MKCGNSSCFNYWMHGGILHNHLKTSNAPNGSCWLHMVISPISLVRKVHQFRWHELLFSVIILLVTK